jgi:hypothetical protein
MDKGQKVDFNDTRNYSIIELPCLAGKSEDHNWLRRLLLTRSHYEKKRERRIKKCWDPWMGKALEITEGRGWSVWFMTRNIELLSRIGECPIPLNHWGILVCDKGKEEMMDRIRNPSRYSTEVWGTLHELRKEAKKPRSVFVSSFQNSDRRYHRVTEYKSSQFYGSFYQGEMRLVYVGQTERDQLALRDIGMFI